MGATSLQLYSWGRLNSNEVEAVRCVGEMMLLLAISDLHEFRCALSGDARDRGWQINVLLA